jgi:hypothetical protein
MVINCSGSIWFHHLPQTPVAFFGGLLSQLTTFVVEGR